MGIWEKSSEHWGTQDNCEGRALAPGKGLEVTTQQWWPPVLGAVPHLGYSFPSLASESGRGYWLSQKGAGAFSDVHWLLGAFSTSRDAPKGGTHPCP